VIKRRRVILPLFVLAAILAGWTLAWMAARALIVRDSPVHADAVLVLSGAPVYFERVAYAGRLFADGRADTVLLTNDGVKGSWSMTLGRNPLYYERATLRLTQAGVPPSSIEILQGPITSTHDEAVLVREYVSAHPIKSLIIITSQYHTRRALWTVRQVFKGTPVEIGIEPADPGQNTPPPATWWLHATGWHTVPVEWVKLPYYWLRYQ
jgi:uncharacterized SAM-binding protein YcdF (DUF218 family)